MPDKRRAEGSLPTGFGKRRRTWQRTWSAQLAVLLLLPGVHLHAPSVEGEGEQVLQAGRRPDDRV